MTFNEGEALHTANTGDGESGMKSRAWHFWIFWEGRLENSSSMDMSRIIFLRVIENIILNMWICIITTQDKTLLRSCDIFVDHL